MAKNVSSGKSSTKKPGDPKCRGCHGLLENSEAIRIGGAKWHYECAVKAGKKIPISSLTVLRASLAVLSLWESS